MNYWWITTKYNKYFFSGNFDSSKPTCACWCECVGLISCCCCCFCYCCSLTHLTNFGRTWIASRYSWSFLTSQQQSLSLGQSWPRVGSKSKNIFIYRLSLFIVRVSSQSTNDFLLLLALKIVGVFITFMYEECECFTYNFSWFKQLIGCGMLQVCIQKPHQPLIIRWVVKIFSHESWNILV